jgi:ribonuclease P protein component
LTKQFTLGKKERLKSRKQIELLFKQGKTFSIFPFKISYILNLSNSELPTPNSRLLFGVGAGTRNFKKAVDRNRIKRLTREAYRLQKNELQQRLLETEKQLNVFFIYTGKEMPNYLLVKEKTAQILNRLIKIVDEKNPMDT